MNGMFFYYRRRHNYIHIVYFVYLTLLHVSAVHVLPDDGSSGQPKHVVVLNKPNIQHLYSCVRCIIKEIWSENIFYLSRLLFIQVIHKQQKPLLFSHREHLKGHLANAALRDNLCLFRQIYRIIKYTVWTKCTFLIFSQTVHLAIAGV
jgi:hypothetical protein